MDFPENLFWDFSIEVHQRPGVHEACLSLQRDYSLDVNLLFFCCWVGHAGGGQLSESELRRAMASVEGWQEKIVRPIWAARWLLKQGFEHYSNEMTEPLRKQLVTSEIDAEHIEQIHLSEVIQILPEADKNVHVRAADAAANLGKYLLLVFDAADYESASVKTRPLVPKGIEDPLSHILAACFPELEGEELPDLMKTFGSSGDTNERT